MSPHFSLFLLCLKQRWNLFKIPLTSLTITLSGSLPGSPGFYGCSTQGCIALNAVVEMPPLLLQKTSRTSKSNDDVVQLVHTDCLIGTSGSVYLCRTSRSNEDVVHLVHIDCLIRTSGSIHLC